MQITKQRKEKGIVGKDARKNRGRFGIQLAKWTGRKRVRRQIKDRLFRFLFEKDKEALLQLYNALNGTDYHDTGTLQTVTIENAVYVAMKNDLAFVIAGTMNLYEHQGTYNPNMPVRFLVYLAEEYQKIITQAESSLYGTKQIPLPTPQCVVFYNGEREAPEEHVLRLSDAFENKKQRVDVELTVQVYNINYGHNEELLEKCRTLKEYAEFVNIARKYIAEGLDRQEALNEAVDYCIDHDILSRFLRKYRAEVLGMLLEEVDFDKYERTLKNEGMEIGKKRERECANRLTIFLLEQNRIDDLKRSAEDDEYRERLLREFNLFDGSVK